MKRLLNITLMAATVCCLSFAVTSCKDDDNNGNSNDNGTSEQADNEPAAAERFWAVAANLVSPFDVTDDYADKTFEPTIGEPTDGNTTVRTVNATDIEVAAASFSSITGADISAETSTYTYHDDAVGTLTYNKSTDGKSLATVDVSIKQIPGLQRIVYQSQEQMGDNAVTDGVPFYSFGDVISRKRNDGVTEYWVCIHPAFTKQGITTTQWATLSPLPAENIWTYTGSNGIDYAVPTKIGKHPKEMQQMAELTYALLTPTTWYNNAIKNGILAFYDIKTTNLKYINDWFWLRAQQQWDDLQIWNKVFGYSREQMNEQGYANSTVNTPLHLLGEGYSWLKKLSNKLSLYQYSYSNGTNKTSNMHNLKYKEVKQNVIDNHIDMNCKTQISSEKPYWKNHDFFGDDNPRYIFRTATGKELFGKKTNPYSTIADGNKIKDVYVYNEKYDITVGQKEKMTELIYVRNKTQADLPIYGYGDVVEDEEGSRWICIAGAPVFAKPTDHQNQTAWFISFDNIKVENGVATNIITENDLAGLTYRMIHFYHSIQHSHMKDFKCDYLTGKRGQIFQQILDYANVNMLDLLMIRDTTWVFKVNGQELGANSECLFTNIVYRSNNTQEPLLWRAIYDNTQGSGERQLCIGVSGKQYCYWQYRNYKHYQTYNPSDIQMSEDEIGFGNTKWNSQWPITNDLMKLSDLKSQQMVNRYATDDKWVRLPYYLYGKHKESGTPRTACEKQNVTVADYTYKKNYLDRKKGTPLTNMWNEPIMMIRLMKVIDDGGTEPNLESTDGRKFKIVHLLDNQLFYNSMTSVMWNGNYPNENLLFHIDNSQADMPKDFR